MGWLVIFYQHVRFLPVFISYRPLFLQQEMCVSGDILSKGDLVDPTSGRMYSMLRRVQHIIGKFGSFSLQENADDTLILKTLLEVCTIIQYLLVLYDSKSKTFCNTFSCLSSLSVYRKKLAILSRPYLRATGHLHVSLQWKSLGTSVKVLLKLLQSWVTYVNVEKHDISQLERTTL